MPDVIVEQTVAAPARVVYDLVSDVTRMGEWSPETTSCRWLGGVSGPAPGARFTGANRDGWRRWLTVCTVTVAEPGREFSFEVDLGPFPISQWSYEFTPDGSGGCVVRESWHDRRPQWMVRLSPVVMGVADRDAHNRNGMQVTLERLRAKAEGAARQAVDEPS